MHRHLALFSFLLLSYSIKAQFTATNDSKWGIIFNPSLTSNPTPSFALQPGVEYRLSDRFYVLTDFAFPVITLYRDSLSHRKYFRVKPEIRYVFNPIRQRRRGFFNWFLSNTLDVSNYIGVQFSYSYRSFRDENGGRYYAQKRNDSIVVAFDNADIKSPVFTGSFQYGALYTIDDNFYLDVFAGVGFRTISSRYSNVTNPHVERYWARGNHNYFVKAYMYPWSITRPHITGGVRLIYRFD